LQRTKWQALEGGSNPSRHAVKSLVRLISWPPGLALVAASPFGLRRVGLGKRAGDLAIVGELAASIERREGAVIGESDTDWPHLIDRRRDHADLAEIGLQAIVIEPFEGASVFWLEMHDEFERSDQQRRGGWHE
jgi:hypothetical protein